MVLEGSGRMSLRPRTSLTKAAPLQKASISLSEILVVRWSLVSSSRTVWITLARSFCAFAR